MNTQEKDKRHTLLVLKPNFFDSEKMFRDILEPEGVVFLKGRDFLYTQEFLMVFYPVLFGTADFFERMIPYFVGKKGRPFLLWWKRRDSLHDFVREKLGYTDPYFAQEGTLRAQFGVNKVENLAHVSANTQEFDREVELLQTYYGTTFEK